MNFLERNTFGGGTHSGCDTFGVRLIWSSTLFEFDTFGEGKFCLVKHQKKFDNLKLEIA